MRFEQQMSQQQKQTQRLSMTQQLQQSIQILQYNSEELFSYIEKQSMENPLIELKTDHKEVDYSSYSSSQHREESNYLQQIPDQHTSLFESLIDQIHLNYRDTYLRTLTLFLVEFIDPNGYVTISLEEAQQKTGAEPIQLIDALTLIQQLDPAGVGARNLQECLMLQTERDQSAPELAYIVLEEDFEGFVQRKWDKIAKKFHVELGTIQQIFDYVQTLTPYPGSIFESVSDTYIRPDLTLRMKNNEMTLVSNKKGQPKLTFQKEYFERMQSTGDKEVQEYLKEKKSEFDWLAKAITQRGDTILKVGTVIVQRQQEFFIQAEHHLQPMTLKEIAEELDIHESTVSRAVNGKYLETPFGVFELRSFFTTGFSNAENTEELSADFIKRQLKELIQKENKAKPLSDQKLVEQLKEQKLAVSRRTITKYREALGIPSSSKRKRYE